MTESDDREIDTHGLSPHDPERVLREKLDEMESQENASFRVYRQHSGNTSKMAFCFTVPADQFSFEELLQKIKDEYGAGDYRIHLRGATEYGKNQLIANQVVSVEATRTANPAPQQSQANELAPIVERMQERMEAMQQRMEERLTAVQSQPQQDPTEMMQKMMATMASMQEMMGGNQGPAKKEKSLIEQIEEAEKIAERFGKMQQEDGGFGQLMREGLQPLIQLAQQHAGQKSEAGNGASPKPNPAQPPAKTGQPAQPTRSQQEMEQQLGPFAHSIRTLLFAAQKNGDPETYADMALDFMSEDQYDDVFRFLSSDGCIDAVIEYVPEVANHREWFESLRRSILASLDVGDAPDETGAHVAGDNSAADAGQPGDPDGAPAGPDGHAEDAPGHGQDGAGSEDAPADSESRAADRLDATE